MYFSIRIKIITRCLPQLHSTLTSTNLNPNHEFIEFRFISYVSQLIISSHLSHFYHYRRNMASETELSSAFHRKDSTSAGIGRWIPRCFQAFQLKLLNQPSAVKTSAQSANCGEQMAGANAHLYTLPTYRAHNSPSTSSEDMNEESHELKPVSVGLLSECNATTATASDNKRGGYKRNCIEVVW